jgi:hypothetical protein
MMNPLYRKTRHEYEYRASFATLLQVRPDLGQNGVKADLEWTISIQPSMLLASWKRIAG